MEQRISKYLSNNLILRETMSKKYLKGEFEILRKMPSLWTRSYFVSTAGNVCGETIKKYVENQKQDIRK